MREYSHAPHEQGQQYAHDIMKQPAAVLKPQERANKSTAGSARAIELLSMDDQEAASCCKRTTKLYLSPAIREATSISLLRKATGELIGTFVIVLASAAGSIAVAKGECGHVGTAVGSGMAVMLMVWALAPISAAHLNPAVTLAFAFARLFPWHQVPAYVLSQTIGSLLASLSLQVIVNDRTLLSVAVNQPLHRSSASVVMEFMATFILMLINMKVACNLGQTGELGASFMIGSTNALLGYYARPFCGSVSMNPARSIGVALVAMDLDFLYIYIFGPIAGAALSGLAYIGIKPT